MKRPYRLALIDIRGCARQFYSDIVKAAFTSIAMALRRLATFELRGHLQKGLDQSETD